MVLIATQIETSALCNLKCPYCPRWKHQKRNLSIINFEFCKDILRQGKENGATNCCLQGYGEPLFCSYLPEIIQFAKNLGYQDIRFTTNATLLNEKWSEKLVVSPLTSITFSVDGWGKNYEQIRNYPFEKIKENIKRFQELNKGAIEIDLEMVKADDNIADAFLLMQEFSPAHILIVPDLDTEAFDEKIFPNSKFRILTKSGNNCVFNPSDKINISWDGRCFPCCRVFERSDKYLMGDLKKQNLKEIWESPKYTEFRNNIENHQWYSECLKCSFRGAEFL